MYPIYKSRDYTAIAAFILTLLSIIVSYIIAKTDDRYLGGLIWPYISDLGRDPPSSYIFFFALNLVAIMLSLTWIFHLDEQMSLVVRYIERRQIPREARALSVGSCIFGVLGAFALPIFSSFRTSDSWKMNNTELMFILCEFMAIAMNTITDYLIFVAKREQIATGVFVALRTSSPITAQERMEEFYVVQRGLIIEVAILFLFTLSAAIYIPVLYRNGPMDRLTIAECISMQLGGTYCNKTMRLNDQETVLWDYGSDLAGNQVRAIAQSACILILVSYSLSLIQTNTINENERHERDEKLYLARTTDTYTPALYSPPATRIKTPHEPRSRSNSWAKSKASSKHSDTKTQSISGESGKKSSPPQSHTRDVALATRRRASDAQMYPHVAV